VTETTTTLPRAPHSIRTARGLVDERAVGAGLNERRRQDAALLVTELMTNALRHGSGAITLRIRQEPTALLVEVGDEGTGTVAMTRHPGPDGGWGLRVIDQLADDWGAYEGSTRVWVRLDLGEPG
jgi:anti-sigma regulatory factor (Ser/Thr protein kinase)